MSEEHKGEVINPGKPKIIPWVAFENEVAEYIQKSIPEGKWGVCPILSKVLQRPKYYSNDRKSDIIFDVSIEVRPAEDPKQLHFLWLIECKHYPDRKVTVDEIEEFHGKMRQVKANKGTVVTCVGFESGAITYAESNRIGLATLQKEEWWTLQFSMEGGAWARTRMAMPFFRDGDLGRCFEFSDLLSRPMGLFGVPVVSPDIGSKTITFEDGPFTVE